MSPMIRDLDRLAGHTFDLLVVGGGIYGLTIAYDAAQRGLSVALIERNDFGSGTSFNHLRTIHGGLRSEEHTSELQSHSDLVCRLLLEKKNETNELQTNMHKL